MVSPDPTIQRYAGNLTAPGAREEAESRNERTNRD